MPVLVDHLPQAHHLGPLFLGSSLRRIDHPRLRFLKHIFKMVDGVLERAHAAHRFPEDVLDHVHLVGFDPPERQVTGMNFLRRKGEVLADHHDGIAPKEARQMEGQMRDSRARG